MYPVIRVPTRLTRGFPRFAGPMVTASYYSFVSRSPVVFHSGLQTSKLREQDSKDERLYLLPGQVRRRSQRDTSLLSTSQIHECSEFGSSISFAAPVALAPGRCVC